MREHWAPKIYAAAGKWVDCALRLDDSLFTPGRPIWSLHVLDDLYQRFVENPDLGNDTFATKFAGQLAGAPAETFQLAGELLYVHFLFPDDISGKAKRALIEKDLGWSAEPVSIPDDLASVLDEGVGSGGVAYKTYRYRHVEFLIGFLRAWKALDAAEQQLLLEDPWAFKTFARDQSVPAAQSQREALLHLVHPDTFESIVSEDIKGRIAKTFADDAGSDPDVDRRLLEIRHALSEKYGPQFNWWDAGVKEQWISAPQPPPPPDALGILADDLLLDVVYLRRIEQLLRHKRQIVFYGPPGTGKTYVAMKLAELLAGDAERARLVQFHPSYAYEDFVEGYRPDPESNGASFSLQHGPLRRIATMAAADPGHTYVLIIDELNRANIAKVFGELYFLLEYRRAELELQYSRKPFSLPENLWLIGTMNTADRSIALVDAALRRRFYFVPFLPDEPPIQGLLGRWLSREKPDLMWVADVVDRANAKLGDRHLAIGPSHFMRDDLDEQWVELIWNHTVLPTIAEQFFGDEARLTEFSLAALRKVPSVAPDDLEGSDAATGAA